jgi:hypothetical protein
MAKNIFTTYLKRNDVYLARGAKRASLLEVKKSGAAFGRPA